MSWTYGNDPAGSARDAVRFHAGLTDQNDQLVNDQEIAYLLVESGGDVYDAAAMALENLSRQFARLAEAEELGRRREEYGDRSAKYAARAKEIREGHGGIAAGPRAPQIKVADREAALADTSRTATQFQLGQFRNPGAG